MPEADAPPPEAPGAAVADSTAWSLTQSITRNMLLVLGLLWLGGSIVLVMGLYYESSEVLDSALQETAERFLFLPEGVVMDPTDQHRFLTEIGAHEEYVVYQIFDGAGQMRLARMVRPRCRSIPPARTASTIPKAGGS